MIRRVLIIAPLNVIYNVWPQEIKKWEDFQSLSYTIVHGKDKAHNIGLLTDVHLINPEGLEWLLKQTSITERGYDVLVVDESTKFKNSQSKRFKLLKPWLDGFKRRWILTGTPSPNSLEDIFAQIYILDLGRALGKYISHFRNEYFHLAGYNLYDWSPNKDSQEKIVEKISPLILRLEAEDYLRMPELMNLTTEVELPRNARKLYDQLEKDLIYAEENLLIVAANRAVAGGKLRQCANGAVYDSNGDWQELHGEKLDALESLLGEISSPTLVLYEFNHDRERILSRLGNVPVLGSGTGPKQRQEIIRDFNAGAIRILLGHPGSMAHGLNLQENCHHVIWFGIPWDLELYDQAIARVYRQGQTKDRVFVYHIVAKDTKDGEVMAALTAKDERQDKLLRALSSHRAENFID